MNQWINYFANSWPRPAAPMSNDFLRANTDAWNEIYRPVVGPLIAAAILFGIIATWLLRTSRPPKQSDIVIWFLSAVCLSLFTTSAGYIDPVAIPVRLFGSGLLWALHLLGLAVTLRRLNRNNPRSFLIETTVVGLIVILLAALAIPSGHVSHRDAHHRTACRNNLKQIGLAIHNFHDDWNTFPAPRLGDPPQSWRVAALPYLDLAPLYRAYHHHQPWDSDANAGFARTPVPALICPAQQNPRDAAGRCLTSYALPVGPQTIWRNPGSLNIRQITDGTSNTVAVIEACGQNIVWNEPRDLDLATTEMTINVPGPQRRTSPSLASSYHRGGVEILLADGSVRFVSSKLDPAILRAGLTATGGEIASGW